MIWFTADQHFNHENIIDYCNRPFNRVGKMDQAIISNYRKVVEPKDTVYFLGDLTLRGPQYEGALEFISQQLPGIKIMILGNHDKYKPFTYMEYGFQSVHTVLDIGEFILVHDPAIATIENGRRWLCGHVHTVFKLAKNNMVLNVGVDQHNFFPVSIDEVRRLMC